MMYLHPFREKIDPSTFAVRGDGGGWNTTAFLAVSLPGVPFRRLSTNPDFQSSSGLLILRLGFWWNGASDPAVDTPDTVLGSMVHDIACTYCMGGYVLPGYLARHRLYRDVCRSQGMTRFRACMDYAGLVLCNWLWMLDDSEGC